MALDNYNLWFEHHLFDENGQRTFPISTTPFVDHITGFFSLDMDLADKQQLQQSLGKSTRHRCSEWIFRDVPSDITIDVSGVIFSLHKFPLVSRSGRIRSLVAEHRDSDISRIELLNLPGGSESFELAAKFCYGINFEITSTNVAQLCCVSDFLEMTEEFSKDNLGSRAEEYLDSIVCKNLEMCIEVLQQCENLLPLADELKIVNRCIEAIASKACAEQIASSFSRLEYSSSGRLHMSRQAKCDGDWWIEDLSVLRIDMYQRVITAMKRRGVRPESIGASLVSYAQKELTKKSSLWNPSSQIKVDSDLIGHEKLVVETIVSLLPVEKLAVPITFLFGLLRSAVMLDCTISSRLDLERRIGSHLDVATIDDLLIPSFKHEGDTLFDVDTVHRILLNFCQQDDSEDDLDDASVFESDSPRSPTQTALVKVAKLVDNYLAEIAPDANLKLSKFMVIAETLPAHARTVHDGLYRAIDIYLKAHPGLSDLEKKKLCKLLDFQKLSQEAGAHAAQNERLPLQSIVQVLYFEQLRLRNALCCSSVEDDPRPMHQSWRMSSGALSAAMSPRDNYASLRRENRELKLELARLRMRLNDLERDHVFLKRDMAKSGSRKFMSSFSRRISKLNFFGLGSSRGSSSPPSRNSQRIDSKVIGRTCASTD
ncbi:BTB/POZ domain-containing protein At5g48800-like [Prosopis cineraria]|uniref:BTB/POZ domain-containing protein At5g48800-like n=1 Tax=Prosopis cineraria TaxID=364024 RepID=UPI00240FEDD9|nr:BTB/POZ domain-containing protein At5g48800-like [Prosopis cineraria]XP_054783027.1 BTB/POZ domain-containing protein At5g48800-like [Prosopis cineraria]XP_054783028.1 BTB/POZ domain-containing protein At5g48800-like [Prosopis cineraria]